jgi:hypothetical protein
MPGLWFFSDSEIKDLDARLDRIETKIDALITSAGKQQEWNMAEADELANLNTIVARNTDVVASAQAALKGFVDITQKLTDELKAAVAADNSAAIKTAADALSANNDALLASIPPMAQAVKANTR